MLTTTTNLQITFNRTAFGYTNFDNFSNTFLIQNFKGVVIIDTLFDIVAEERT